nr:hypothetical protein BaRGS_030679 [Batillaria attramentaria]
MQERHPDFVHKLEQEGVRYTRVLPDGDDPTSPIGRGWQSTFQTEDKAEAEHNIFEFFKESNLCYQI